MVKNAAHDFTGKRIWITGATGYLGRSFVSALERKIPGSLPVLLVRSRPNEPDPRVKYAVAQDSGKGFTGDELRKLRDASPPDALLHFATRFQGAYGAADAEKMIDANITFPVRLLEACRGLPYVRFLNFGSFYSHADGTADGPLSFYAATKRSFESFLNFYGQTPGWRAVTLKIFDTYGPGDDRPKLVPKWVEILKSGEEMKLSPGGQKLSLVFVDDVVDATATALALLFAGDAQWPCGHRIYQLPAKKNLRELPTLKEIAEEFERAAGKKLPVKFGALPYRDNEIMTPSMDFPILPGWEPKVDLLTGFRKLLNP